ncbi:MAG TPA: hypothetical protein VHO28_14475 [Ignavibacteriales bacterium]|nr:hypothetical protein [Ignavibacteriales bacterium]
MKKWLYLIIAAAFPFFFCACDEDEIIYEKCEKPFNDALTVAAHDTTNIVIEQNYMEIDHYEIPFEITSSDITDSVRIDMDVDFCSFDGLPAPNKDIEYAGDTVYIWYSAFDPLYGAALYKAASVKTPPEYQHYNIQKASIKKPVNTIVTFKYRASEHHFSYQQ